jgi:hypothetical protein
MGWFANVRFSILVHKLHRLADFLSDGKTFKFKGLMGADVLYTYDERAVYHIVLKVRAIAGRARPRRISELKYTQDQHSWEETREFVRCVQPPASPVEPLDRDCAGPTDEYLVLGCFRRWVCLHPSGTR